MGKKKLTATQIIERMASLLWQGRSVRVYRQGAAGWYVAVADGKPARYLGRDQHAAAKFLCLLYAKNGGSF